MILQFMAGITLYIVCLLHWANLYYKITPFQFSSGPCFYLITWFIQDLWAFSSTLSTTEQSICPLPIWKFSSWMKVGLAKYIDMNEFIINIYHYWKPWYLLPFNQVLMYEPNNSCICLYKFIFIFIFSFCFSFLYELLLFSESLQIIMPLYGLLTMRYIFNQNKNII